MNYVLTICSGRGERKNSLVRNESGFLLFSLSLRKKKNEQNVSFAFDDRLDMGDKEFTGQEERMKIKKKKNRKVKKRDREREGKPENW